MTMRRVTGYVGSLSVCLLALIADSVGARVASLPEIRVSDTGVVEGNAGARSVELHVILSEPAPSAITVDYATRNGTATGGSDYQIKNGTLTFNQGDTSRKILVNVVGDTAIEANETIDVVLTAPSGATLADDTGTITIVNDDFPPGGPPTYEVRFTYTGYAGTFRGSPDCPVRKNGQVTLGGMVSGSERVPASDDIEYTGSLWLSVDIDLCEVDRNSNGEDYFCGIVAVGDALLDGRLSVYADSRGGYIATDKIPGAFFGAMFPGPKGCTKTYVNNELANFPTNTTANPFNGEELKVPSGPLRVGLYPSSQDWVFEVLRKVR